MFAIVITGRKSTLRIDQHTSHIPSYTLNVHLQRTNEQHDACVCWFHDAHVAAYKCNHNLIIDYQCVTKFTVSALSVKFTTHNLPQQKAGLVNDAIVSSQLTLACVRKPEKTLPNLICNWIKGYWINLFNQIMSDDTSIHWSGARNVFSYAMLSSQLEDNNDPDVGMPKPDFFGFFLVSIIHKCAFHFQCLNTDMDWRNASFHVWYYATRWLMTRISTSYCIISHNTIQKGQWQSHFLERKDQIIRWAMIHVSLRCNEGWRQMSNKHKVANKDR